MKHPVLVLFITLLPTFTHVTCRAAETQVLNGLAAVVNEDVITFSEVRELTGSLESSLKATYSGTALSDRIKEIRLRAVNDLIDRQLIIQEFHKMKGQIPPHAIEDRLNAVIRQEFGGDRSAFLRTIAAQGFTLDRIRKLEEEKIIVQAMRSREIKNEPVIPPGQIESYYHEHRQEWTTNDEVKLRMIKIVPGSEPEKKKKMIREIRDKIIRGADFADMARIYSEDSTQDKGGDWGWVKHGDLNPDMEQAVFRLSTGKVSEVIELNQTYYLLLAEQKKGGTSKPLKDVRDEIEKRLLQIERQKQQQIWLERLRKKAYIKIH